MGIVMVKEEELLLQMTSRLKIGIRQALLCLPGILLVACSSFLTSNPAPGQVTGGPQKAPLSQQVYRIPAAPVQSFDPAVAPDVPSIQAVDMVFTGLVTLDDHLLVQPQLAATIQQGGDGLTWTFTLKPHLKFSDGTPLTSHDVAYSIDRALQPATNSKVAFTFLNLIKDSDLLHSGKIKTIINDSLFTPDDNTLIIFANKNVPYFLKSLTEPPSYVVEKSMVDRYGKAFTQHLNEGGGAGPFIVSQYNPDYGIDFVPNPNYYDARPQLQKVTFSFYQSEDNAYRGYQIGQLDETPVSLTTFAQDKNSPDFHNIPELTVGYFMMNYLVKPFDNIHIRQAFALATDRDAIASKIYDSLVLATYHIVPQGMEGYYENLTGPIGVTNRAGDPVLARELFQEGLREEGWTSTSQVPVIKLTYNGFAGDPMITSVIQGWQSVLGIRIQADPVASFSILTSEVENTTGNPHGLQFWEQGWSATYVDPRVFTGQLFEKNSPENYVNYGQNNSTDATEQQSVQAQLATADTLPDSPGRLALYYQAEQALVDDVAFMPLFQSVNNYLLKPYVKGTSFTNPTPLIPPDDWANIYIAAH